MTTRTTATAGLRLVLSIVVLLASVNAARAQQRCDSERPETTPVQRLNVDMVQGRVFDTKTGLTWNICPEQFKYSNGHCGGNIGNGEFTWDQAAKQFSNLPDGWRLPSIQELQSIVEKRCSDPSINGHVFPDTPAVWFWSSSAFAGDADYAYAVYFGRGLVGTELKINTFYIRLVRDKEWRERPDSSTKR